MDPRTRLLGRAVIYIFFNIVNSRRIGPNQPLERTGHTVRRFARSGSMACGPPLTGGVSAPSKAWRFLWGVSPHRVRSNQPLVPSVASVKEVKAERYR